MRMNIRDVKFTNKGLLPPRMSQSDRDAIQSPAAGLMIYNTTTRSINVFDGTEWYSLGRQTPDLADYDGPYPVECPDGDLFTPVITHIMQSRSKRQPTENGKPIFDNNRLLVYAKNVPIDVRTAGGAKLALQQDGTIEVSNENGADVQLKADGSVYVKTSTFITMEGAVPAVDFVAKGTAQNAQLITAFNELSKAMTAIVTAFSSVNVPCSECTTAATVMSTASLIALSAHARRCCPCICSANSARRRWSSSGSPNRSPSPPLSMFAS